MSHNKRGINQITSIGTGTKVRINMTIAIYPIILCFFRGKTSSSNNGADLNRVITINKIAQIPQLGQNKLAIAEK